MIQKTLAIIKPDAIKDKVSGAIIQLIELNDFTILNMNKSHLSREQSEKFYNIHKDKPFFEELVNHMISGPVILMALEKENAIQAWRELMGATDPEKAALGTIRRMFGKSIGSNATHGSDSEENAKKELSFFFSDL